MKKNLTPQQNSFIDEYIVTLNPTQSALNAGYAKSTAKSRALELLANPRIIQELHDRLERQALSLDVNKAFVLKKLLDILTDSTALKQPLDKAGNPVGDKKIADSAVALRALDYLCRLSLNPAADSTVASDALRVLCIENLNEDRI